MRPCFDREVQEVAALAWREDVQRSIGREASGVEEEEDDTQMRLEKVIDPNKKRNRSP